MKLSVVYLLMLLGIVLAEPAPDISELKITSCNCDRCIVTQTGYAIHGSVYITFNGGKVNAIFCALK